MVKRTTKAAAPSLHFVHSYYTIMLGIIRTCKQNIEISCKPFKKSILSSSISGELVKHHNKMIVA